MVVRRDRGGGRARHPHVDPAYFAGVSRPLYLLDMAVDPAHQRRGIGRVMLEQAADVARHWPAGAIRLDAYDHAAGAGGFYLKCGFRAVGRVVYRGVPLIYLEHLCSDPQRNFEVEDAQ